MEKVYLADAVRTPIGSFGGSLKKKSASELAAIVTEEIINRVSIQPEKIDEVIFGCTGQIGEDAYIARYAAIKADIPETATAFSVNRLCASGLQSIISAVQTIQCEDVQITIAGGSESMSGFPFLDYQKRWGHKMGESTSKDALSVLLSDPFEKYTMGITAENVAEKYGVTREEQDFFALRSQEKADKALQSNRFKEEIIPVEIQEKKGKTRIFDMDEYPKPNTSLEKLGSLRSAFKKNGTVTAGNSSGINDGASAVMLMSEKSILDTGVKPLASIKSYAFSGVDPAIMGVGPIPAVKKALERAELTMDDIGLIESNEAFASQSIVVANELGFEEEKLNVNGGAIALGHPVGATGNILTVKLVHEMKKRDVRYGLVTLCIGGGQGCAVIFENVGN